MVISGCPRVDIQATALQLLQILDKRFFGSVGLLQGEKEKGERCFSVNLKRIVLWVISVYEMFHSTLFGLFV